MVTVTIATDRFINVLNAHHARCCLGLEIVTLEPENSSVYLSSPTWFSAWPWRF
jgi:hypothetical protein